MSFENIKATNNAQVHFFGGVGASTTTFILRNGEGGLIANEFPTLGICEKYDTSGRVTRREIVKITGKSGDILTVVRAFEECPASFDSLVQTQTSYPFDDGDIITVGITAETLKQLSNELTRLENDKLNKSTYNLERQVFSASVEGNDSYKITSADILTYNNGQTFKIQADVGNDGAATLELNTLGSKTIKKYKSGVLSNLETGDISAGQIFWATYNNLADCFQFSVDPASVTIPDVASTKSTFIAGENITAGNALCVSGSNVFKIDASNSSKINFIGFATNTITTGGNVIVDTAGVSATQSGLTVGSDYYLGGELSTSSNITVDSGTGANFKIGRDTNYFAVGQTFTTTDNLYISKVEVYLGKTGSPTDNIRMEIRTSTTGGAIQVSNTIISGTSLGTTPTKQEFLFDFSIPAGTTYTIYLYRTGSIDASNYYGIYDTTSNIYAGGSAYGYSSSGVATAYTTLDLRFIITANTLIFGGKISSIKYIPFGLPIVKVGQAVSSTGILIEENIDSLNGTTSTTAITGSIVLGNAVGYITVKINGVDRKIPYYS